MAMSLKVYRKKRNFTKTPEPAGKVSRQKKQKKKFVIQKHAASHLHYDFRLELNGTLISWAVPKGPCFDPKIKRLAMHVEDHPLEYGKFEGIIPKGQYGGGTVMLWDRGEWIPEDDNPTAAYHKGDLSFSLIGEKLHGRWKLIRMHQDDKTWLLMKVNDDYAKPLKEYDVLETEPNSVKTGRTMDEITERKKSPSRLSKIKHSLTNRIKNLLPSFLKKSTMPKAISPELATLVEKPPQGNDWLHEIKFDGYRLIAFKKSKKVNLFTRNQNDWTNKFAMVKEAVQSLSVDNVIIDGEVVVLDDNQHSNFQLLQNAIKEQNDVNFLYYVFDIIFLSGARLTQLPLIQRKAILASIIPKDHAVLKLSEHVIGNGEAILKNACKLGLEGIVSKQVNSAYVEVRSKEWLKSKCTKRQEFIVGGFTKPKNTRQHFGALLLGAYNKKNKLIYHGRVGTGFTDASLKEMYKLLSKSVTSHCPFTKQPPDNSQGQVTWVDPKIIVEVEFTEWTKDQILRHPSFKGVRADKNPRSIIKEKPIKVGSGMSKISKSAIQIPVSHPTKILYPEDGITKQEIADYYQVVHEWILPYIDNRLLTLVRCPSGYQKKCFYQKHMNEARVKGLYEIPIQEKHKKENYVYIKDETGLYQLIQLNTLEIHIWGSSIKEIEYPDRIVIDLDPAPDVSWSTVVKSALEIRDHLKAFKLRSFVMSTGGKGLHIVIPIQPEYDWETVKEFTHTFVKFLVLNEPGRYIGEMNKAKRTGKIFLDYLRNQRGATAIAPFSTRAREHAPVAAPLAWDELTNHFEDTVYTIKTLPLRLSNLKSDPWKDYFKTSQSLHLDKLPKS